jgi:hypothetical protein
MAMTSSSLCQCSCHNRLQLQPRNTKIWRDDLSIPLTPLQQQRELFHANLRDWIHNHITTNDFTFRGYMTATNSNKSYLLSNPVICVIRPLRWSCTLLDGCVSQKSRCDFCWSRLENQYPANMGFSIVTVRLTKRFSSHLLQNVRTSRFLR